MRSLESNYWATCTDCYAVPGEGHIIDVIDPTSGLTVHLGKPQEAVLAEHPAAVRMTVEAWRHAHKILQRTPISWDATTAEQYDSMLGCLPPADWFRGAFLVGEPSDHDSGNGAARFDAYRCTGTPPALQYSRSSRPLTRAEFRAEQRSQ